MPADQVRQIIEAELGAPIDLLFEWLELDEPLGSASIAQVGRIGRVEPAAAGGSSRLLGQRAVLAVGVRTLRVGAASHASKFSQVHLSVASGQLLLLPLPLLLLLLLLPLLLLLDHPASQPVASAVGPSCCPACLLAALQVHKGKLRCAAARQQRQPPFFLPVWDFLRGGHSGVPAIAPSGRPPVDMLAACEHGPRDGVVAVKVGLGSVRAEGGEGLGWWAVAGLPGGR